MRNSIYELNQVRNERGVSAIFVALIMVVLLGVAAFAIDIGHLTLVKNELQNAADAGALTGAQKLYSSDGTINTGADNDAGIVATANKSELLAVEVGPADVERGHWSFATRTFTANPSTDPVNILGYSFAELDANTDFINAVRVTSRREATPAASFFAKIFGNESFGLNTRAVAYRTTAPELSFDVPIAICRQAIVDSDGGYSCNVGRMINSGGGGTGQSGGWTSFVQQPSCNAANASEMRDIVLQTRICGGNGVNSSLNLFQGVSTVNGQQESVYGPLYDCWKNSATLKDPVTLAYPNKHATWTLPVIECSSDGRVVNPCSQVVGAVKVDVVWITDQNDPHYNKVPQRMDDWTCPSACSTNSNPGKCCWNGNGTAVDSFVSHFGLSDVSGTSAGYMDKTIYFKPECSAGVGNGSGGYSYFKTPVLVNIPLNTSE